MLLIKGIHVYAPQNLGIQDVLLANDKLITLAKHIPQTSFMDVYDGSGKILTPGFLDRHVHIIGGGGEGGFATRAYEIQLSSLLQSGITSVVGLLGTDGITRSMEQLIAKVKGLKEEGISAYAMSGSYSIYGPYLSDNIQKDILFVDEILGAKLALSDHRSSHASYEELLRLASDIRVASMIAKKAGCITLHMGDERDSLQTVFKILQHTDLPISLFHPTHVTRNPVLFQEALQFLSMGGTIDITAKHNGNSASFIRCANPKDYGRITLSSDGQGSWSEYDDMGNIIAIGIADVSVLFHDVISMVKESAMPLETALRFVTSNPAKVLHLYPKKGCIQDGSDADLLLFNDDLTLSGVIALGKWMMKDGILNAKGTFE